MINFALFISIAAVTENDVATVYLPYGGVVFVLLYLLRIVFMDRRTWEKERASLIEQHRLDKEATYADLLRTNRYLRDRVHELEQELEDEVNRHRRA